VAFMRFRNISEEEVLVAGRGADMCDPGTPTTKAERELSVREPPMRNLFPSV